MFQNLRKLKKLKLRKNRCINKDYSEGTYKARQLPMTLLDILTNSTNSNSTTPTAQMPPPTSNATAPDSPLASGWGDSSFNSLQSDLGYCYVNYIFEELKNLAEKDEELEESLRKMKKDINHFHLEKKV